MHYFLEKQKNLILHFETILGPYCPNNLKMKFSP